nr:Yip1 family protein [uncultured Aminipila sp.]
MNDFNNQIENIDNNEIDNNENSIVETEANNDSDTQEKMNPWFSMWTKPSKTMRYIINDNPRKYIIPLAMIYGVLTALDKASLKSMGDTFSFWSILLIAIVGGSIGGICYVYLDAILLRWTGTWIGGKGSTEHIRAAITWGSIPYIIVSVLWIPELILYGEELFTTATPTIDASISLSMLLIALGMIEFVFSIWSVIVGLKCLGEVQGFSAWKALGNSILAGLVILVPVIIVIILIVITIGGASI